MIRAELHFRGGSVMEVEADDLETFRAGLLHKIAAMDFKYSEKAKQSVVKLDTDEVV